MGCRLWLLLLEKLIWFNNCGFEITCLTYKWATHVIPTSDLLPFPTIGCEFCWSSWRSLTGAVVPVEVPCLRSSLAGETARVELPGTHAELPCQRSGEGRRRQSGEEHRRERSCAADRSRRASPARVREGPRHVVLGRGRCRGLSMHNQSCALGAHRKGEERKKMNRHLHNLWHVSNFLVHKHVKAGREVLSILYSSKISFWPKCPGAFGPFG